MGSAMQLTLDDETARMAAELRLQFRGVIANAINDYYRRPEAINWSAVVVALMMVSADTNNVVGLDKEEALQCFRRFLDGRHYRSPDETSH
jgi:hypothetical protein